MMALAGPGALGPYSRFASVRNLRTNSDLGVAARTLTLDLVTAEVVRNFDSLGIDCMVLKGPAMAYRLYQDAPGSRNYGDIDLLVAPRHFDDAGRQLASLGFEDDLAGARATEAALLQERPWRRRGTVCVTVDLHRGFHHVADWPAWWEVLSQHRDMLVIEGQPVVIPDQIGCALITALHASKATSLDKAVEDLRRALQLFDDEAWRQAAGLARSVGAANAFAAALYRQSAGAELAARLGLAVTDPVVWFRATSAGRGAGALCVVLEAGGWAARARRLRDAVFPSRACLAGSRPIANRGLGGLGVAHARRLGVIATRLPGLLLAWYVASRAVDRTGGSAPRLRTPLRTGRPLRTRAAAFAATGWWTLRTWWRVHRWLARGPGESGACPVTVVPVECGMAYSRRAAQLVLATCRATCLETAHIRQARAAAAGRAVDVVVGVTAPASGFRAHAWLDGDQVDPGFVELCRYPAAQAEAGPLQRTG